MSSRPTAACRTCARSQSGLRLLQRVLNRSRRLGRSRIFLLKQKRVWTLRATTRDNLLRPQSLPNLRMEAIPVANVDSIGVVIGAATEEETAPSVARQKRRPRGLLALQSDISRSCCPESRF